VNEVAGHDGRRLLGHVIERDGGKRCEAFTAAAKPLRGDSHGAGAGTGYTDTAGMGFAAPCKLKTARLSEADDDYPRIVARLNDRWRVIESKCELQWILQRRDAAPVANWRGSAFCRTRNGLMGNIQERTGEVADSAMRIVEQLPEWHLACDAERHRKGEP
jgi:hypothetical protein